MEQEQSAYESLRHEFSAMKKKADAQTMQLIDAESRIVALQIENDGLKGENQRLKSSDVFTDSTVETVKTLHRQFMSASTELKSSRKEVDSLKQTLDVKTRQCEEISLKRDSEDRQSTDRIERLVRQVLDANTVLIQEKNKVARLEQEKEALRRQLCDAEVRLNEAATTAKSLSQELDVAKKEAGEQCRLVEALRAQVRALEANRFDEPPATKPRSTDVGTKQKQEEILAAISSDFTELIQSVPDISPVGSADDSGVASDSSASPVIEDISSLNDP